MNLVKKSLVERETRGRVRAFEEIEALLRASLLSMLNLLTRPWPASLFCSLVKLAGELTQKFCQILDPGTIAMEI